MANLYVSITGTDDPKIRQLFETIKEIVEENVAEDNALIAATVNYSTQENVRRGNVVYPDVGYGYPDEF